MTSKPSHRFLFVTYRWGEDLTGGAEIHHRRLVHDLIELGHEVEVWTTTGRDISPVAHWGVEWHEGYDPGVHEENGVRVRRFPIRKTPRLLLALACKRMQKRVEHRTMWDQDLEWLRSASLRRADDPVVYLFDGWHHPEVTGEGVQRWSMPHAALLVRDASQGGRLRVEGMAPHKTSVHIGESLHELNGDFSVNVEVAASSKAPEEIALTVHRPFRPRRDHRTLGILVRRIEWIPKDGAPALCDLWRDVRDLGRHHPDEWRKHLLESALQTPDKWGTQFDLLRGPRSPALRKALRKPPEGFDFVIAANLPWSIIPMVADQCPLPMLAMPLWHIEDDYYYWPHYLESLKKAKLVLANTPYSSERFFKPLGVHARFVGPGVPPPPEPAEPFDALAWKRKNGIPEDEAVVLTVCRKSPEKRYDLVVAAVEELRANRPVRLVLIGPDADKRPLPDHVSYLGRVSDDELDAAYRACDVFVLMSETESFGMVLAEAWMRGKPVIANRLCGPAASLVQEGEDGLLAVSAKELAEAIATLLDRPDKARHMVEAGREKALHEYTQRAATKRLLAAIEETQDRKNVQ